AAHAALDVALSLYKLAPGDQRKDIAWLHHERGRLFQKQLLHAEAKSAFRNEMQLIESIYKDDPTNMSYGGICHNYGEILFEYGDYDEAQKYLLRALNIWDKPHCSCHL
ncbi:MAG: tetratricopeptide repeat protein, partial [Gemmataceae bacterium]